MIENFEQLSTSIIGHWKKFSEKMNRDYLAIF